MRNPKLGPSPSQNLSEMRTADFSYNLPPERIAQHPIEPRDHSRLLVVSRRTGLLKHRHFFDLPDLLQPEDLLVLNDSRVIPARLHARKATGGAVELLLLVRRDDGWWQSLARPSRRLRPGLTLTVQSATRTYKIEVGERHNDGTIDVLPESDDLIADCGEPPLPPYIHEPLTDGERYQTVYSRVQGSAAAPTAGLHFTVELMHRLKHRGIGMTYVTLHVGLDTFRPVEAEDPRDHHIHTEYGILPPLAVQAIADTRQHRGRVVAVGTTSVRLLESAAQRTGGEVKPYCGNTGLMIMPGHEFKTVDALITNFHLPQSTLIMLVSAFGGKELVDTAYAEAIRESYRFYSFGDAMLIL